MAKLVSIVVPIYYEEAIIPQLYNRLKAVVNSFVSQYHHEIIFINDGSKDNSLELLKQICVVDNSVKVLNLSRNFGHQIAITAGIDRAEGDAVVVIDGDLQDPPEIIIEMIKKWEEGYKVVYGVRKKRKGENFFKIATAKIFYRLIGRLSKVKFPLDTGDFRLMDRLVVNALKSIREENRYIRGIVSWIGFAQIGIPYERDARFAGKTKYSFTKMVKLAFDGIFSFSDTPLKLSSVIGFWITLLSFLFALKIVIDKVVNPQFLISGWASLITIVLFMGGIQLFMVGIIGQYIGRIYSEVKRRPLYIIEEEFHCTSRISDNEIIIHTINAKNQPVQIPKSR